MIEKVIYTPEADDDVTESYDWCESREPGLGEDFLRCVESCVLAIQRQPRAYPIAVDTFRHVPIRRFPFEVFYEPTEDAIIVYSVFHCSQDPKKWRKRLGYEWTLRFDSLRSCPGGPLRRSARLLRSSSTHYSGSL